MLKFHILQTAVSVCVLLIQLSLSVMAAEKSADDVAKELSNPAGSLASLNFNLEYTDYKGDLPNADDQNRTALTFQPTLPFPLCDNGRKIIFRPLFTMPFDQPIFNTTKGDFDSADLSLADTTFDLVYAGTTMRDKHNGYLWGAGLAGTLPTATEDDLQGDQWRFGPDWLVKLTVTPVISNPFIGLF